MDVIDRIEAEMESGDRDATHAQGGIINNDNSIGGETESGVDSQSTTSDWDSFVSDHIDMSGFHVENIDVENTLNVVLDSKMDGVMCGIWAENDNIKSFLVQPVDILVKPTNSGLSIHEQQFGPINFDLHFVVDYPSQLFAIEDQIKNENEKLEDIYVDIDSYMLMGFTDVEFIQSKSGTGADHITTDVPIFPLPGLCMGMNSRAEPLTTNGQERGYNIAVDYVSDQEEVKEAMKKTVSDFPD